MTEPKPSLIWIVTYGNYVHGVFSTEEKANEYMDARWPAESRGPFQFNVSCTSWYADTGWDPMESKTRSYA